MPTPSCVFFLSDVFSASVLNTKRITISPCIINLGILLPEAWPGNQFMNHSHHPRMVNSTSSLCLKAVTFPRNTSQLISAYLLWSTARKPMFSSIGIKPHHYTNHPATPLPPTTTIKQQTCFNRDRRIFWVGLYDAEELRSSHSILFWIY